MIGTNWDGVARELSFATAAEMWTRFYVEQEMSLEEIARRFGVSQGMVRAQLTKAGITLRTRGGANYRKIIITDELRRDCEVRGTKQVASELGVSYTALHKALRKTAPTTPPSEPHSEALPPGEGEVEESYEPDVRTSGDPETS